MSRFILVFFLITLCGCEAAPPPPMGPKLTVGEATVYDLKTGKQLRTFRRYDTTLRHVLFAPDGDAALLSFIDHCVLWDTRTGETLQEFDQGGIAQFAADDASVLIYGGLAATRYDIATGKQVETIPLSPYGGEFKSRYTLKNAHLPNEVRHDASGTLVYTTRGTGVQLILDASTAKEVGRSPHNQGMCFVSGATERVLQGGPLRPYDLVRVFDFKEQELSRFEMPPSELPGVGGQLAAVSADGAIFLYAQHVKQGGDPANPKAQYRTMAYTLHDAGSGEELQSLGRFEGSYTAGFSPDGARTILLPQFGFQGNDARDPEIIVIDNATGAVVHRLYSGPWALPSFGFDQSGDRLIVAGAINFKFWRRFGEWIQMEKTQPMPRKAADALKIIDEY